MKKLLAFIISAGILVAMGTWFIANSPGFFSDVVEWAKTSVGM